MDVCSEFALPMSLGVNTQHVFAAKYHEVRTNTELVPQKGGKTDLEQKTKVSKGKRQFHGYMCSPATTGRAAYSSSLMYKHSSISP